MPFTFVVAKEVVELYGKEFLNHPVGTGAFILPKLYNSWILSEDTCQWESPVAYPDDDKEYKWNESNKTWDYIPKPDMVVY